MDLFSIRRRSLARIGATLAALCASLIGAAAAQGALGTSNTLITSNRPDLISVTTPGSQSGSIAADFCFTKGLGIAGGASAADFALGGYDSDEFMPGDDFNQISNFCIEVLFNGSNGDGSDDLVAYTFGQVAEGAVVADAGGGANLADSTALNGSNTNNGTRGFTTGPDLILNDIRAAQNQIAYVFDQEIKELTCPVNNGFVFIDGQGDEFNSVGCSVTSLPGQSRNTVAVAQFPPGSDVTNAEIVYAANSTALSQTFGSNGNRRFALTAEGATGDTNDADLQSAELVAGGDSDQMLFTYRTGPISEGDPGECVAIFSDGTVESADTMAITGPDTALIDFGADFSNATEYVVGGGDEGGCVIGANTEDSTTVARPAGGNIGAFGTGYSTGADAQALTINRANDDAVVRLDQRIDPDDIDLSCIHLVGANGNNIANPLTATVPTQAPGPQNLSLDFAGGSIPAGTVGIRLNGADTYEDCVNDAFQTLPSAGGVGPGEDNVEQVFAP
jgi:hypothetical protein